MSELSDTAAAATREAGSSAARAREREIVRGALAQVALGQTDAYVRVVELFQHRLLNLVLMAVRDRAAAEDVVQEAFIRAYTHLDAYDAERDFYPWIATIAVRLAQNWRRRAREHARDDLAEDHELAGDGSVLGDVLSEETARQLWQAVGALPSGERMSVMMYYRQDMKVEEIARALGVTSGTVKTLLFRARAKLRRMMQHEISDHASQDLSP